MTDPGADAQPVLVLYTTAGCHLCEQAEWILRNQLAGFALKLVDIAESETLVARYGVRIPVIALQGAVTELGWPFDAEQVADYLDANLPE